MTLDWTALAIAVIGFAIGFVTGYGVSAPQGSAVTPQLF
jgi:hypothetical protein